MSNTPTSPEKMRKALLVIGAQHPVWNGDRMPNYDRFVNSLLSTAREAVDAQGADDDAKADWCAAEMEKYP